MTSPLRHRFDCQCASCDSFGLLHFALDAIHEAARLAQVVRANGLMIVNGVVYGPAGHGVTVTFAAHTQALAELRDTQVDNDSLRAENAHLHREIAELRALLPSPRARGEGRGEGQTEDEGEFGPEILEAADR